MHPVVRAAFWMLGSLTSFTGMALGARELSSELGTFQQLLCRSIIGLPLIGVLILVHGLHLARTRHLRIHLVRNASHFCGQFGWFYGIALIPLAEVFAIEFTLPLWTTVFAIFMLGERFTRLRSVTLALGFLGVLLILRPGADVIQPGAVAVLLGSVAYGFSYTLTKRLAGLDPPLTILFYMTLIQLVIGVAPGVYFWVTPSAHLLPWVLVIGVTAMSAQYCLARALALADASVVVPMDFVRLPLISGIGFAIYGERIDWMMICGALLIFSASLISVLAEQRKSAT
ncbi:MAG: DMT family transporter [Burkholderiales bacterium]